MANIKIYYSAIHNSEMLWSRGKGEGLDERWLNREKINIEEL